MSEEATDQAVEVESSGGEASQPTDIMTGDFFDDDAFYDEGYDAVVDNNGIPIKNENGDLVKTMDDYRKMKDGDTGSGKQPKEGETTEDGEPWKLSSAFQKDGEFDFDGIMKTSSNLKDFSYDMRSKVKQPEPGQPGFQQPVNQKERITTTVNELRTKLTTERLEPIKSIYGAASQAITGVYQAAGQQVPAEVAEALYKSIDSFYRKAEEEIGTTIDTRRDELLDEAINSKSSESELKENRIESSKNLKSVSDKMFSNVPESKREEFLGELIFGRVGENGKHEPGFGTDIVNALFDEAMNGKEFNSPQELQESYNSWWYRFSSDPSKMQLVSMLSYAKFLFSNPDGLKGAYRKAFDKEVATKNRNKNNQSRSSGVAIEEVNDPLHDYHTKL